MSKKTKIILYLTIKKKWFDQIARGEKKYEYREMKPYWTTRLFHRDKAVRYAEIHFRNGYQKNNPFMRVEFGGVDIIVHPFCSEYRIKLGKILEIRNWKNDND